MERKTFTLRLSADEAEAVEILRQYLCVSTDTAALRHAILKFKEIDEKSFEKSKKISELQSELSKLKDLIKHLLDVAKAFTSMEL